MFLTNHLTDEELNNFFSACARVAKETSKFRRKNTWRQKQLFTKYIEEHFDVAPVVYRKINDLHKSLNWKDVDGYFSIKTFTFFCYVGLVFEGVCSSYGFSRPLEVCELARIPKEESLIGFLTQCFFCGQFATKSAFRWVSTDVVALLEKTNTPEEVSIGVGFPFENVILFFPKKSQNAPSVFFRVSDQVILLGVGDNESQGIHPIDVEIKNDSLFLHDCKPEADGLEIEQNIALFFKTIAFCSLEDRVDVVKTQSTKGFSLVEKAKKERDSLKNPVWIDIEPQKSIRAIKAGSSKGTHASPSTHWRSGHFRLQHYGENNTKTKTIWIRPTLVSANGD